MITKSLATQGGRTYDNYSFGKTGGLLENCETLTFGKWRPFSVSALEGLQG